MAKVVHDHLVDWEAAEKVVGMCFDTTASNTGCKKGASQWLQKKYLKKKLLNFACRHHVLEIILKGVYITCFGETKGPGVVIFNRFKNAWSTLDKSNFRVNVVIFFCFRAIIKLFHNFSHWRTNILNTDLHPVNEKR